MWPFKKDEPLKPGNFGTAPNLGRVRLLQNIMEGTGVKCVRRKRKADGSYLIEVPFVKGAIIDLSEATANKYIAAGLAERAP